MFARISAFVAIVVAVAASARMERHIHVRRDTAPNTSPSQCNTGDVRCCNSIANASDVASVLDFLSYSYDPADSVGIDCTPFNIYGAGEAASCQQQPICCSNNTYSGSMSINVGCSPMNLN